MTLLTARVLADGHLDIPAEYLQQGGLVTVLVSEAADDHPLTAAQKAELRESIEQADRGEVIDGWKLLGELEG